MSVGEVGLLRVVPPQPRQGKPKGAYALRCASCDGRTAESKPFCDQHVLEHDYAQDVRRRLGLLEQADPAHLEHELLAMLFEREQTAAHLARHCLAEVSAEQVGDVLRRLRSRGLVEADVFGRTPTWGLRAGVHQRLAAGDFSAPAPPRQERRPAVGKQRKWEIVTREQVLDFLETREMSQLELAEVLKVDRSSVSNWLTGKAVPFRKNQQRIVELMRKHGQTARPPAKAEAEAEAEKPKRKVKAKAKGHMRLKDSLTSDPAGDLLPVSGDGDGKPSITRAPGLITDVRGEGGTMIAGVAKGEAPTAMEWESTIELAQADEEPLVQIALRRGLRKVAKAAGWLRRTLEQVEERGQQGRVGAPPEAAKNAG